MKTNNFVFFSVTAILFWGISSFTVSPVLAQKADSATEQKKAEVRKTVKETLNRLYNQQPNAKKVVQNAAGYAVFSNFGMKIFFVGGGSGQGIAVDNTSKKETFMKMIEAQAGLGIGVKKFRLVWVFQTEEALNTFISSGWELGSQATASAQYDEKGGGLAGAIAVSKDVWLYQLTDDGLALELTAKGTRYYKDDELN